MDHWLSLVRFALSLGLTSIMKKSIYISWLLGGTAHSLTFEKKERQNDFKADREMMQEGYQGNLIPILGFSKLDETGKKTGLACHDLFQFHNWNATL
jgi:hypothetical protein